MLKQRLNHCEPWYFGPAITPRGSGAVWGLGGPCCLLPGRIPFPHAADPAIPAESDCDDAFLPMTDLTLLWIDWKHRGNRSKLRFCSASCSQRGGGDGAGDGEAADPAHREGVRLSGQDKVPGAQSWVRGGIRFQQRKTWERASWMRLADTQWRRPAVRRELGGRPGWNRWPQSPGRGHNEDASGGVSVRKARSWDQSWRNASVWSSGRETEAEETGFRFQLRLPDFW